MVVTYRDSAWGHGTAVVVAPNTKSSFFAIAQEGGLTGETKKVAMIGDISSVHTGAIPGENAYIQSNGSLGETITNHLVGTYISPTELKLYPTNGIYDAIALKADDTAVVHDTGNETVAGIKTFSSFPVTPSSACTTDYQVANKKYVDDNSSAGKKQCYEIYQDATAMTRRTGDALGFNLGTASISNNGDGLVTIANTSDITRFTATEKCCLSFSWGGRQESAGYCIQTLHYNSSGTLLQRIWGNVQYSAQEQNDMSCQVCLAPGDYLIIAITLSTAAAIYGYVRASFIAFDI